MQLQIKLLEYPIPAATRHKNGHMAISSECSRICCALYMLLGLVLNYMFDLKNLTNIRTRAPEGRIGRSQETRRASS